MLFNTCWLLYVNKFYLLILALILSRKALIVGHVRVSWDILKLMRRNILKHPVCCKQERLQNLISPSQARSVGIFWTFFFFECVFSCSKSYMENAERWRRIGLSLLGYTQDRITDKFRGSKTRYQVKTLPQYLDVNYSTKSISSHVLTPTQPFYFLPKLFALPCLKT